jgi:hypothetical protein
LSWWTHRWTNHGHGADGLKMADKRLRLCPIKALASTQILRRDGLGHRGERQTVLGRESSRKPRLARSAGISGTHHEDVEQIAHHSFQYIDAWVERETSARSIATTT